MKRFRPLSRRGFLIGAGAAATIGAPALGQGHAMRRIAPNRASDAFTPDVELELICKRDETSILTGKADAGVALRRQSDQRSAECADGAA